MWTPDLEEKYKNSIQGRVYLWFFVNIMKKVNNNDNEKGKKVCWIKVLLIVKN